MRSEAETVDARNRLSRSAFKSEAACLIPSSGFYEWKATGAKHKQPYHFRRMDGALLGFAGLWEHWRNSEGQSIEDVFDHHYHGERASCGRFTTGCQ